MRSSWGMVVGSALVCGALAGCGGGGHDAEKPAPAVSTSTSASSDSSGTPSMSSTGSSASSAGASASATGSTAGSATSKASHPSSSSGATSQGAGAATGSGANGAGSAGASVATPRSAAVRISIPSIGLDHSIVAGGLRGGVLDPVSGTIQQFVGYGRVSPGKPGISVLAGHVTYNGPDVFYSLASTPVGGKVTITYADGTHKDFVVSSKASVNKEALQNDARVWGASATPVIALVTCDAASGWVNAQHHANNFVVWARPA